MNIPLDRLYQYIENIAQEIRGDRVIIYRFWPHGSKKLKDFRSLYTYPTDVSKFSYPGMIMHDQEPLKHDLYHEDEIVACCSLIGTNFNWPVTEQTLPNELEIINLYKNLHLRLLTQTWFGIFDF